MSDTNRQSALRFWAQFTSGQRKQMIAARMKGHEHRLTSEDCRAGGGRSVGKFGRMASDRAPSIAPTMLDIAWAAGIIEGEGCIVKSQKGYERVHVGQKHRWIVDRLQQLFGWRVGIYRHPSTRMYFQWQLSGPRARGLLYTIFTFLSPHKKNHVRKALGHAEHLAVS